MRVFVTGATGVIGSRAVVQFIEAGHQVTAVARTPEKMDQLRASGADAVSIDLFDAAELCTAVDGHDAVAQLATRIPAGAAAMTARGWRDNDRLRTTAAKRIADAAATAGVQRLLQESITFPYDDSGADWIDESAVRTYVPANRSTETAEATALAFGGVGVVLRFAMFWARESAHVKTFTNAARRGVCGFIGRPDSYISFVHADDAAAAIVHAMGLPGGVYNVAEPEPRLRSEQAASLAAVVGRRRLRMVPEAIDRLAGSGAASIARSHRVSTDALHAVSGWRPEHRVIDCWGQMS